MFIFNPAIGLQVVHCPELLHDILNDLTVCSAMYPIDVSEQRVAYQTLFRKYIEPVRPARSYPRKGKGIRTKGKYQTLTNYKRAI